MTNVQNSCRLLLFLVAPCVGQLHQQLISCTLFMDTATVFDDFDNLLQRWYTRSNSKVERVNCMLITGLQKVPYPSSLSQVVTLFGSFECSTVVWFTSQRFIIRITMNSHQSMIATSVGIGTCIYNALNLQNTCSIRVLVQS